MLLSLIRYPVLQTWAALVFSESQPSLLSREYTSLFPGGSNSKESVCKAGDLVRSLGWEDPLEKRMATYSSILAWRIPWTEEPGGLQSTESQRIRHNWTTNTFTFFSHSVVWKWDKGSVGAVLIHLVCFSSLWAHCSSFSHVQCLRKLLIYILSSLKWEGKPGHCCSILEVKVI